MTAPRPLCQATTASLRLLCHVAIASVGSFESVKVRWRSTAMATSLAWSRAPHSFAHHVDVA